MCKSTKLTFSFKNFNSIKTYFSNCHLYDSTTLKANVLKGFKLLHFQNSCTCLTFWTHNWSVDSKLWELTVKNIYSKCYLLLQSPQFYLQVLKSINNYYYQMKWPLFFIRFFILLLIFQIKIINYLSFINLNCSPFMFKTINNYFHKFETWIIFQTLNKINLIFLFLLIHHHCFRTQKLINLSF